MLTVNKKKQIRLNKAEQNLRRNLRKLDRTTYLYKIDDKILLNLFLENNIEYHVLLSLKERIDTRLTCINPTIFLDSFSCLARKWTTKAVPFSTRINSRISNKFKRPACQFHFYHLLQVFFLLLDAIFVLLWLKGEEFQLGLIDFSVGLIDHYFLPVAVFRYPALQYQSFQGH